MRQTIRSFLMGALGLVLASPCSATLISQNVQFTSPFTGESHVADDNTILAVGNEVNSIRNGSWIQFLNISTVGAAAVTITASGTSARVKVGFARSLNMGDKHFGHLRITKKSPD